MLTQGQDSGDRGEPTIGKDTAGWGRVLMEFRQIESIEPTDSACGCCPILSAPFLSCHNHLAFLNLNINAHPH
jgi:hypothetical protein